MSRYNITQANFLQALANTAALAKNTPWTYGDSQSLPPCADDKISCDRLVSRSLWDLGVTDQPRGGWISAQLPQALPSIGFTMTTNRNEIIPGTVVIVGKMVNGVPDNTYHTFAVTAYDPVTDLCDKYDMGSDIRIQQPQPFRNVPLVEWSDRWFSYAFLPPDGTGPGPGGGNKTWLYFKHYGWRQKNGCACFLS